MSTISGILFAFSIQWAHPDTPPKQVTPSDLTSSEIALGVQFPEEYKEEVLSAGLPSPSLALLSAIVDQEVDLHDLTELNTPNEILEETMSWREIGLPSNLIVIGTDGMGNKFCFDATDLQGGKVQAAPIYFWDHDFEKVDFVANSFRDWIGTYSGEWSEGISYKDF